MSNQLQGQPYFMPDLSTPRFPKSSRYFGMQALLHTRADGTPQPYLERRFPPHPASMDTFGSYTCAAPDRRDLAAANALGMAGLWWQMSDAAGATDPDQVVDQPGVAVRLAIDPRGQG